MILGTSCKSPRPVWWGCFVISTSIRAAVWMLFWEIRSQGRESPSPPGIAVPPVQRECLWAQWHMGSNQEPGFYSLEKSLHWFSLHLNPAPPSPALLFMRSERQPWGGERCTSERLNVNWPSRGDHFPAEAAVIIIIMLAWTWHFFSLQHRVWNYLLMPLAQQWAAEQKRGWGPQSMLLWRD